MTQPLKGVRIADFTIHAAGPFATHLLAQMGAECIKIESSARPDIFRKPHAVYGRMEAATFDQVSSGKLSVRLNLKDPRGRDLARRIVGESDIAAESFRPGVMERLGLAYEDLRAIKQDIVMLSVSSSGQTGPDSRFAGYAPLFGAWGGLGRLTGYPDGAPVEIRHVMDHTVGSHAAGATLAALVKRRLRGVGSYIDIAAREVASAMIGHALVEAATGIETQREGNGSSVIAPSGVYPVKGEDNWVTIAIADDAMWQRAVEAIGGSLPNGISAQSTLVERMQRDSDISSWITNWTRARTADQVTEQLQSSGVAAHPVYDTASVVADAHMRERNALIPVREPNGKERYAVGLPARFSDSDTGIWRGTPELGQDEDYVFGELLGLGRAERNELEEEGVIS